MRPRDEIQDLQQQILDRLDKVETITKYPCLVYWDSLSVEQKC